MCVCVCATLCALRCVWWALTRGSVLCVRPQFQPVTIGQASRLGGVSPADVTGLILHLELEKRQRAAADKRAAAAAREGGAAAADEGGAAAARGEEEGAALV